MAMLIAWAPGAGAATGWRNATDPWTGCGTPGACPGLIGADGHWRPAVVQQMYLRAIDRARSAEGLGPLALPLDFARLEATAQVIALFDAERTSRGLHAFAGTGTQLTALARQGSAANGDPDLGALPVSVAHAGGVWYGASDPLAADFMFLYDDGWGGSQTATPNLACTGPAAPGCWGHRDAPPGSATSPLGVGCMWRGARISSRCTGPGGQRT